MPGSEGKCTAAKGKPAHGKCDGDADGVCAGSCDGTNRTACTYPEVECAKGSCAGGTASVAPKCKAGSCPAPATQVCALGCYEDGCLGVKQIAPDYGHVCALLTDGTVRCWGDNSLGQCSFTGGGVIDTPTDTGLSDVISIASASSTTCAVFANGTIKCWGANTSGQLGANIAMDNVGHPTPVLVSGITGATFVGGASGGHFCAIVANGGLQCWGSNYAGQLGRGTKTQGETTPLAVCAVGSTQTPCAVATGAKFVTGGDNYTCAIFAGDQVACWGSNNQGQTGQAALGETKFPTYVTGNLTGTYLAAGNSLTCAASGGNAKCFGSNGSAGRVGNCDTANASYAEPQIVGASADCKTPLSGVTAVSTSDESVCAVANGAVKCWGTGTGGQFGDGTSSGTNKYAATTAIATGAVYVASGGALNYAIVQNGVERDVRCWGGEGSSQCGTGGTSASRLSPVAPKWK